MRQADNNVVHHKIVYYFAIFLDTILVWKGRALARPRFRGGLM